MKQYQAAFFQNRKQGQECHKQPGGSPWLLVITRQLKNLRDSPERSFCFTSPVFST